MTALRHAVAELLGTAMLLAAVVGSGIMAERLAGGNVALALLANAIATGGALVALILTYGPISGAHFNPLVTAVFLIRGHLPIRVALPMMAAQVIGAIAGVWLAHLMFGLPILQLATHARGSIGERVGELVATFGLIMLILGLNRRAEAAAPYGVAAYITGAYWFTSSTAFANPAVAIARCLTDSFAGIAPADVTGFIGAEAVGALAALGISLWLHRMDDSLGEATARDARRR